VRSLLVSVVDSGTAVKADLATFRLAGKSGTARRTTQGRYVEGNYTASFVGLFPAEKPQYVVLVKLDSPRRAYYGGEVAAPVSAVVLRAALAARDAALDRGELADEKQDVAFSPSDSNAAADSMMPDAQASPPAADTSPELSPPEIDSFVEKTPRPALTIELPLSRNASPGPIVPRAVPQVGHLSTRRAVRALHSAGFRVTLSRSQSAPTIPAAGTMLPPGSIVKLRHIP
jgi:cell division protein FtsI (penicillin-binding protein 3)